MNNRNEEKELLLKDLCARLPYETRVRYIYAFAGAVGISGYSDEGILSYDKLQDFSLPNVGYEKRRVDNILPYLRPMSSMTKEEKQESRWYKHDAKSDDFILYMNRYAEWLDSKHFDWRTDGNGKTMIELGLALKAPDGMYEIK